MKVSIIFFTLVTYGYILILFISVSANLCLS